MTKNNVIWSLVGLGLLIYPPFTEAQNTRSTETYRQMRTFIDSIPAIDSHDHLHPWSKLSELVETTEGKGVNLAGLLGSCYYSWYHPMPRWQPNQAFDDWWTGAKKGLANARATSFYRFLLPAFADLYGVDFDQITDEQARDLDRRIFENYKDRRWVTQVITERANIELIVNDPFWARLDEKPDYPFCALVFNVTPLVWGYHPEKNENPHNNPYEFARRQGMEVRSLDDYLALLDRLFAERKAAGAVCIKNTLAYNRTLDFANVPRERAEQAFGKKAEELTAAQIKDFEDFIMWRLTELAAKYDLPYQIHTGQARIQGSNPMLLVDLIQANPKTKFVLFHGGFPWVGETGVIVMRNANNVWVDSVWLPTLSYTMAKRAFHEWLEVMPSNRIMWGADCIHVEGIYGATALTRQCLAEVLAEKIDRGDLLKDHAMRIARQIMRENALELYPQLNDMLWKDKGNSPLPGHAPGQKTD